MKAWKHGEGEDDFDGGGVFGGFPWWGVILMLATCWCWLPLLIGWALLQSAYDFFFDDDGGSGRDK